ncbi:MAG: hypothetical protein M3261_04905 [Thermoproteota archaeon]|nr:hypothetical protein [Thermoproteota archaeon]
MGQIYNVLIILAITLLMALTTTVLAYFVDRLPHVVDSNVALVESSNTAIVDSEPTLVD